MLATLRYRLVRLQPASSRNLVHHYRESLAVFVQEAELRGTSCQVAKLKGSVCNSYDLIFLHD